MGLWVRSEAMVYHAVGPSVDSSQSMPGCFCPQEYWHSSLWKMRLARVGGQLSSIHKHTHGSQLSWEDNGHTTLALEDFTESRVTIHRWDFRPRRNRADWFQSFIWLPWEVKRLSQAQSIVMFGVPNSELALFSAIPHFLDLDPVALPIKHLL